MSAGPSSSKGKGKGQLKTPQSSLLKNYGSINQSIGLEQQPGHVVSIDETETSTPFYSLMFVDPTTASIYQNISDLADFLTTNLPPYSALTGSSQPIQLQLRKVIFEGLQLRIDNFFNKVKSELQATVNATKLGNDVIEALKSFDCINNIEKIKSKNIMVKIKFKDMLTATGKERVSSIELTQLCVNMKNFRIAITDAVAPNPTGLDDFELIVSQSEFIKNYLLNILDQTTMNVSSTRDLFETLSPEEQCTQSAKMTWPSQYDLELRFNTDYEWEKYCYICGLKIFPAKTGKSQCEHILFVLQACALNCLIQRRRPMPTDDPLSIALYMLEYAGSHPCCNNLKSNKQFIKINPTTQRAEVDREAVKAVLRDIKKHSDDTTSGLKCSSLNDIAKDAKVKEPSKWTEDDIKTRADIIIKFFLDPLVKRLNERLAQTLPHTYSTERVLELFIRMNQISALEVSLEQVTCCILAGGAIKLPDSFTLVSITSGILYPKDGKPAFIDETTKRDKNSDFDLSLYYEYQSNLKPLVEAAKNFLRQKINETQRSSRRSKTPPISGTGVAKVPTPVPDEPEMHISADDVEAILGNAPNVELTTAPAFGLADIQWNAPNVVPNTAPAPKLPENPSLQQLMIELKTAVGDTFKYVLYKKCFDNDTKIDQSIFSNSIDVGGSTALFEHQGGHIFATKLRYYFKNLIANFYSIRPSVFESEKYEFITLCKQYMALEVIYILTYNLDTNTTLQGLLKYSPDLAKTILSKCLEFYNANYTNFMIKWFLYSSIDIILKTSLDFLLGTEDEQSEYDKSERDNSIIAKCGSVYLDILNFFKQFPDLLRSVFTECFKNGITNENIQSIVGDASEILQAKITDPTTFQQFNNLIIVKEHEDIQFALKDLDFERLPLPPVQPPQPPPPPPSPLPHAVAEPMAGGVRPQPKWAEDLNSLFVTKRKDKFRTFINSNEGIRKHIDTINRLKIVVTNLGAYDVGSAIITKISPLIDSIASTSTNAIEKGILKKLKADINKTKTLINMNMAKRAIYALYKLKICTNEEAVRYVNNILHGDKQTIAVNINQIVERMGIQLFETMIAQQQIRHKPMLKLKLSLKQLRNSYVKSKYDERMDLRRSTHKAKTRRSIAVVNIGIRPTTPRARRVSGTPRARRASGTPRARRASGTPRAPITPRAPRGSRTPRGPRPPTTSISPTTPTTPTTLRTPTTPTTPKEPRAYRTPTSPNASLSQFLNTGKKRQKTDANATGQKTNDTRKRLMVPKFILPKSIFPTRKFQRVARQ